MKLKRHTVSFAVLAVMSTFLNCADMEQEEWEPDTSKLIIGLSLPLTGPIGQFGRSMDASARLAASEINAAGGVNGQQIEMVVRDTKLNADVALEGIKELDALGVQCIIGAAASSMTTAVANGYTTEKGIPLISPSSTAPEITDLGNVWRTAQSDDYQGVELANFVAEESVTKAALIYVDSVYGQGLFNAFKETFEALGHSVVASVPYEEGKESGFSSEVTTLLEASPEGIIIIGFATDGANITRDLKAASPDDSIKYFGGEGLYSPEFLANADQSIAAVMKGTAPKADTESENTTTFNTNYKNIVGQDPTIYGSNAYDATYLCALAMAKGGANTAEAARNNLAAVSKDETDDKTELVVNVGQASEALTAIANGTAINYEGASGNVDFDDNGDVVTGVTRWQVTGSAGSLSYETVQ